MSGGLGAATAVNGADVTVKKDGDAVMIKNAKVTTADVAASNGGIHVIDAVLLPDAM